MATITDKRTYDIDASGQKLGRLASEIAVKLLGKDAPDFKPNVVAPVHVTVVNASQMAITQKKMDQTEYDRYSGYPSGRKVFTMKELIAKKGYAEVLRKAVYGMLPGNKLRVPRMKNLTITE